MKQLAPEANKFHAGAGADGKHYWLTPPELYAELDAQYSFDFDPCPYPKPDDFDGLTCEWGQSNYVNPPFGSIMHDGKRKGATAWVRKALAEHAKGKRVVLVYPLDKWVLMLVKAGARIENLGDVRWHSTEDRQPGKGTGRHIAAFVLDHERSGSPLPTAPISGAVDFKAHVVEVLGDVMGELRIARDSSQGSMVEQVANELRRLHSENAGIWRARESLIQENARLRGSPLPTPALSLETDKP